MGYVPKRTLYKLDFSQTEHAGLEVTTKSASMAALLDILGLADSVETAGVKNADRGQMEQLFGLFDEVLVSWNVETEDGEAVPATKAGLLSQDPEFVMTVIGAWAQAMAKAPPNLPGGSSSGSNPVEASIPMTPAAPSNPQSS
jgi:hypothetical protein